MSKSHNKNCNWTAFFGLTELILLNSHHPHTVQHDVLRLPSHVAQVDNTADREWHSAATDRNLPSTSCLKVKIVYGSGFLNLFGSQASAEAAIVQMVKDTNVRFKSGNYPGLNTDITVDVLKSEYYYNIYITTIAEMLSVF